MAPAESVEGRALTKRNTIEAVANCTQRRLFASFGLYGVCRRAEQKKEDVVWSILFLTGDLWRHTQGKSRMR
jgi:hypothetical protein